MTADWRYTLAVTWVRKSEKPTAVLGRLWQQVAKCEIACELALLDRYFFTVPVMAWLQSKGWPFVIPVVMRGRKPKRGTKAKGLRAVRDWKAGTYAYTHSAGSESVEIRLVVTFKSHVHPRTKKRRVKQLVFATWKVRRSPVSVRETYRRRFGIEASYRQLNESRPRTSSRDPLYRLLLVGLSLFLRNLWQWMLWDYPQKEKRRRSGEGRREKLVTYRLLDVLDAFVEFLTNELQVPKGPSPAA